MTSAALALALNEAGFLLIQGTYTSEISSAEFEVDVISIQYLPTQFLVSTSSLEPSEASVERRGYFILPLAREIKMTMALCTYLTSFTI